jgi:uncharacterized Ntn-hydrolase superfamily protein
VSDEEIALVAKAALDGAAAAFNGRDYAVVVVVREIGGKRAKAAGNMMGGRETMIRTLQEAIDGLRGTRIIV